MNGICPQRNSGPNISQNFRALENVHVKSRLPKCNARRQPADSSANYDGPAICT
jgi:hypothetical protein